MKTHWPIDVVGLYVPIRKSFLCIGYDGLGAVDGVASDVVSLSGEKFTENPVFEEMRLAAVDGIPHIHMRRAVRRFDFYYVDNHNLLILSERAFALVGKSLGSSVDGFREVVCHFGAWSGAYLLAKLRHSKTAYDKSIAIRESTFLLVKSLSSKQDAVEQGLRDPLDESHIVQRGIRFESPHRAMDASDFSTDILLEDANVAFAEVAMFNYKPGITYLRLSLYEQLLTLKQSQRQVLGILGSQPFATVKFAPG